jgi:hypothetical protein
VVGEAHGVGFGVADADGGSRGDHGW